MYWMRRLDFVTMDGMGGAEMGVWEYWRRGEGDERGWKEGKEFVKLGHTYIHLGWSLVFRVTFWCCEYSGRTSDPITYVDAMVS